MSACQSQSQSTEISNNKDWHRIAKIVNPDYGVSCGLVDRQDRIWIGSFGEGAFVYHENSLTHFNELNGLCSDEIYTIFEDQSGIIWFGTSTGLCKYDGEAFAQISIPFSDTSSLWLDKVYPVINPNAVQAIAQDSHGHYWLGTGGGGAYRYDGVSFTAYLTDIGAQYEDSLHHNWIPGITIDEQGDIWFASMSYGGLTRYDGNRFDTYYIEDGLSDNMIRTIYEDQNGRIWLGFNGNRNSALTVFAEDSFYTYSLKANTCHRNIRCILEDHEGQFWLGGEGGICILHNNVFSDFLDDRDEPFVGIIFIIEDAQRNIWFGGRKGLWLYDGDTMVKMTN